MKIAYLTGADGNRMLNMGILLESFHRHEPARTLGICDFGLNEREREFWRRLPGFKEMPAPLHPFAHTWYRKAAMLDYLGDDEFDAAVWLDADMIVNGPIHAPLCRLVETMAENGEAVKACRDASGFTLAGFADHFASCGVDTEPLRTMMARHGSDPAAPYVNTGFLILRDRAFARAWRDAVLDQPEWLLFEQNVFNCLVHAPGGRLGDLEAATWNVHGDLLDPSRLTLGGKGALVLHTTSEDQRHHIENEIRYPIGDRVLPGWFKLFVRDDLKALQQELIVQFLQRHADDLDACGLRVRPQS